MNKQEKGALGSRLLHHPLLKAPFHDNKVRWQKCSCANEYFSMIKTCTYLYQKKKMVRNNALFPEGWEEATCQKQ